jgi:hypothetical protein
MDRHPKPFTKGDMLTRASGHPNVRPTILNLQVQALAKSRTAPAQAE